MAGVVVTLVLAALAAIVWIFLDPPEVEIELLMDREEAARRELAKFAQEWADAHPPTPLDEIERRRSHENETDYSGR